jgi:hypothetical protein
MTFDNIKFERHSAIPGAIMGRLVLPNGISLSVVGGIDSGLYGDGVHTFEVFVSTHDDAFGLCYQTREDINELTASLTKE